MLDNCNPAPHIKSIFSPFLNSLAAYVYGLKMLFFINKIIFSQPDNRTNCNPAPVRYQVLVLAYVSKKEKRERGSALQSAL
jgi:hypothetical protein